MDHVVVCARVDIALAISAPFVNSNRFEIFALEEQMLQADCATSVTSFGSSTRAGGYVRLHVLNLDPGVGSDVFNAEQSGAFSVSPARPTTFELFSNAQTGFGDVGMLGRTGSWIAFTHAAGVRRTRT